MRSAEQPQSMYTPIPQNMTDSDSEEEFRLQINNCQFKGSQIVARNLRATNMHTTMSRLPDTLPDVRLANAQPHYTNHNRLPSDADNVAILNANVRKRTPMSALRKICFVASIFVCIFTVIVFVWILPCSDGFHSCPAKSERMHTHNWLRNYEGIELKGTINVVPGIRGRSKNRFHTTQIKSLVALIISNDYFSRTSQIRISSSCIGVAIFSRTQAKREHRRRQSRMVSFQ